MRCENKVCKRIIDGAAMSLSVSPDGKRIALVTFGKRGPVVTVAAADGSGVRELVETETACKAGWASTKTLWVSRRRGGTPVWLEIDADSARDTGKSVPGSRDCSDARPDPISPVQPDVRVVFQQTSQLRLIDRRFLR
jgi:hypothetical protein